MLCVGVDDTRFGVGAGRVPLDSGAVSLMALFDLGGLGGAAIEVFAGIERPGTSVACGLVGSAGGASPVSCGVSAPLLGLP
jgi:hypothetical protein